jgi:hypothetical protein
MACQDGEAEVPFQLDAFREFGDGTGAVIAVSGPLPSAEENRDVYRWFESLDEGLAEAKALGEILRRRKRHLDTWQGQEFPYELGIAVKDDNTEFAPGIVVTEALERTPFDIPIVFKPGDRIVEFNEKTVFSVDDLALLLDEFAQTKGVGEAFPVVYQRSGEWFETKGTFFFNERAFKRSAEGELEATKLGTIVGAIPGLGREVACLPFFRETFGIEPDAPDFSACRWQLIQRSYLLAQLYPDAYDAGQILGSILFQPLRRVVTALLDSVSPELAKNEVIVSGVTEAVENAVIAYTGTPSGVPDDVLRERIVRGGVIGGVIGGATAIVTRPAVEVRPGR